MKHFGISILVATFLTGLSYIVGIKAGWLTDQINWIEVAAVFTSYSCTYLCVMQKRFNYVIGAISTTLLFMVYWQSNLMASAVQNALLTPWLAYGWVRWRADEVTRPVTSLFRDDKRLLLGYAGLTFLTYAACVMAVNMFGGNLPFIDAGILVGSILAQILLDNKRLESWYVWFIVDIAAIGLYFEQGLYLVAFQFVFFLANTIWGWYEWNKTMNRNQRFDIKYA